MHSKGPRGRLRRPNRDRFRSRSAEAAQPRLQRDKLDQIDQIRPHEAVAELLQSQPEALGVDVSALGDLGEPAGTEDLLVERPLPLD